MQRVSPLFCLISLLRIELAQPTDDSVKINSMPAGRDASAPASIDDPMHAANDYGSEVERRTAVAPHSTSRQLLTADTINGALDPPRPALADAPTSSTDIARR